VESLFCSRFDQGRFVKIDFSQMELRILADLSGDEGMLEAFREGKDFHQATADRMDISRFNAKTLNFKIVYQGGSRDETERWFAAYPKARAWVQKQINIFKRKQSVESPLGRRRILGPQKQNFKDRLHQERQAVNSIIQGMASDLTMVALILLAEKYIVVNTIHDSILIDHNGFDVCDENMMRDICENEVPKKLKEWFGYEIKCPLKVDIAAASNWGECE
jgi:DNA polymerase-1